MPTINASKNASIYGRSYTEALSVTADNGVEFAPTLAAAKTGTLTTRTDANTGSITGQSGHGIATADKIDIYWTGGSRRNVTVGTVASLVIPIDLGDGDDLPVATTALTIMKLNAEGAWDITGANVKGIVFQALTYTATFVLRQSDDTEILAVVLPPGTSYIWTAEDGVTNPVTGVDVAKVTITHGGSGGSQICPGALVYD